MMKIRRAEIEARVGRLLGGSRNPEDLLAIFLWAREYPLARRTVKDVGDLIAHATERVQGRLWEHASYMQAISTAEWYHGLEQYLNKNQYVNLVKANAALAPPENVLKELKMSKKRAIRALNAAITLIADIKDGRLKYSSQPSETQRKVLRHFALRNVFRPAYTQKSLVDELGEVLLNNRLLSSKDIPRLRAMGDFIGAFVLTRVHLTTLSKDGFEVKLYMFEQPDEQGKLGIWGDVPFPEQPSNIECCFFLSDCTCTDWCDEELRASSTKTWTKDCDFGAGMAGYTTGSGAERWLQPMELSASGKIRVIS